MSKQEIMYSHVEDWQASGLTQSKYCESVGIKLATFSYWVVKFKGETEQEGSSNFIAISKTSKTEGKQYEIVYPNGVKLRLVYIPMKVHHHSDKVHQLDYLL